MKPIVVIPCRMDSTLLPGKPLAAIGGAPLIVHVWRRATESACGPVVVACDHAAVAEAILAVGGRAVLTRAAHASGTGRVAEALAAVDPYGRHDAVINFPGDLPTLPPAVTQATLALLDRPEVALALPVALLAVGRGGEGSGMVGMIGRPLGERRLRAVSFARVPAARAEVPLHCHVGPQAWRRGAFEQFVAMPPTPRERREKPEQQRILEAGMRIDAVLLDQPPLVVGTAADLDRARVLLDPAAAALRPRRG